MKEYLRWFNCLITLGKLQLQEISSFLGITTHVCVNESAWLSGWERRFYDDHDRKVDALIPTQTSLLRPW